MTTKVMYELTQKDIQKAIIEYINNQNDYYFSEEDKPQVFLAQLGNKEVIATVSISRKGEENEG